MAEAAAASNHLAKRYGKVFTFANTYFTMNWKPIMRLLCHQKEERCYWMCSEPLIVCSRCLGIYFGFLLTFIFLLISFGFFTRRVEFLLAVLFLVPMGIDGVSQLFKFRESNNPLRFFTGYLAGFAVALVFYATVSRLLKIPSEGMLPNLFSLIPLLFIPPLILIYEKFNNSQNLLLKKISNFVAIATAVFLVIAVIAVYGIVIKNFIATL